MGHHNSAEDSKQTLKSVERPLPLPAQRALAKLGADINLARRRRAWSQQALAERAGVSLSTVKRLEAGDPRMQLHVLARVLGLFGELDNLNLLLDTREDDIGLALMDEQLPKRIRRRKPGPVAF